MNCSTVLISDTLRHWIYGLKAIGDKTEKWAEGTNQHSLSQSIRSGHHLCKLIGSTCDKDIKMHWTIAGTV